MKKYFATVVSIITIILLVVNFGYIFRNRASIYKDEVSYVCKAEDNNFYVYNYGEWDKTFIKGVNIGSAKPGTFPGELSITKDEYLRWFKYIGKMNANAIRVYTVMTPDFYEALYEYNKKTLKPIYVFQGVWVNEEEISKYMNIQNSEIKDEFKKDIKDLINIIHGNANLEPRKGHASGLYKRDVSPYVIGWILGIEWDPHLVINTNEVNNDDYRYDGKYLYVKDASPFEKFLCEMGDYAIEYETSSYNMQRPLSFVNWPTTDTLIHLNEPFEDEDIAEVNTEHIKSKNTFKAGLFATYHIYPYYPDFMNYEHKYTSYRDDEGKINTYEAYLKDLIQKHTVPVLVGEFGVPSSRGMTHESIYMGYNQGNIDEKSQGLMDGEMLKSIYKEGYAGGLIFTWQDEWFKRTWNTMELDIPYMRPYWSNTQTNEQEFGLLAFDPGMQESICYVDGDVEEWKNDTPLVSNKNFKIYAKSDEKYVYFMADIKDFDFNNDTFIISIDTTPNSGNSEYKKLNIEFERPTDYIIQIKKDSSRIMVDSYYDVFYYQYGENLNMIPKNENYLKKDNGLFNPINLCLNRELYLPQDKKIVPIQYYETGKLKIGDGNPEHANYNSLTDYSVNNNYIEIRIPWQLLNVMDPSSKKIMDDFYKNDIKPMDVNGFYIGGHLISNNNVEKSSMNFFSWKKWDTPTYHERLKKSYYILKDIFKDIGKR